MKMTRTEMLGNICLDAVNTLASMPEQVFEHTDLMCKTIILNKEFEPLFNKKMAELRAEAEVVLRERGMTPMPDFTKQPNPVTEAIAGLVHELRRAENPNG